MRKDTHTRTEESKTVDEKERAWMWVVQVSIDRNHPSELFHNNTRLCVFFGGPFLPACLLNCEHVNSLLRCHGVFYRQEGKKRGWFRYRASYGIEGIGGILEQWGEL